MSREGEAGCYNFARSAVLAATALLSGGCNQSGKVTPIREVVSAQAQYAGQEVSVRGVVSDASRVPVANIKLYSLEQDGVRIVVVTEGELPPLKQMLKVRGRVLPPSAVNGIAVRPRMAETERRIIQ